MKLVGADVDDDPSGAVGHDGQQGGPQLGRQVAVQVAAHPDDRHADSVFTDNPKSMYPGKSVRPHPVMGGRSRCTPSVTASTFVSATSTAVPPASLGACWSCLLNHSAPISDRQTIPLQLPDSAHVAQTRPVEHADVGDGQSAGRQLALRGSNRSDAWRRRRPWTICPRSRSRSWPG